MITTNIKSKEATIRTEDLRAQGATTARRTKTKIRSEGVKAPETNLIRVETHRDLNRLRCGHLPLNLRTNPRRRSPRRAPHWVTMNSIHGRKRLLTKVEMHSSQETGASASEL